MCRKYTESDVLKACLAGDDASHSVKAIRLHRSSGVETERHGK